MNSLRLSVVVATYNRFPLLARLLNQLAAQTIDPELFEVVVVDDGSAEPVGPQLEKLTLPYSLLVLEQPNSGAAAARHRGALEASGDILVIVDDDMQIPPSFLEAHLKAHQGHRHRCVQGRIRTDPAIGSMPIFERYNARVLDRWAAKASRGEISVRGFDLRTGNVSMERADYLATGGFDLSLERSEDAELGIRLEKAGVEFIFSELAYTVHGSDHTDPAHFLSRAYRYGGYDLRIARKHASKADVDPWRYLFSSNPVARPFLLGSLLFPTVAAPVSRAAMRTAVAADNLGLERLGLGATRVAFGMEYFRGIRQEVGSMKSALRSFKEFVAKSPRMALASEAWANLKQDYAAQRGYQQKFRPQKANSQSMGKALVEKVGLQLAAGYRLMRFFRAARLPVAARVTSRLVRHLYGSDIHWDANLSPGVMFVHGMGLAISDQAQVGPGCILFQNVTLGMGIDPQTRVSGAPNLEANVHVGPGATLLGPITVGAGSKIMAGAVVTESVPPGSLVAAPHPKVSPRKSMPHLGRSPATANGASSSAPQRIGGIEHLPTRVA